MSWLIYNHESSSIHHKTNPPWSFGSSLSNFRWGIYTIEIKCYFSVIFQPSIIFFIDINIKWQKDGVELAEIIRTKTKKPFVFITSYADKNTLERAKHTLPYGYILKPFSEAELKATIEIALFRFDNEKDGAVPDLSAINHRIDTELTQKEYEVLLDIYNGLANQQIASKQFISVNTVKTHVKNLYSKIDVHSRAELVRWLSKIG